MCLQLTFVFSVLPIVMWTLGYEAIATRWWFPHQQSWSTWLTYTSSRSQGKLSPNQRKLYTSRSNSGELGCCDSSKHAHIFSNHRSARQILSRTIAPTVGFSICTRIEGPQRSRPLMIADQHKGTPHLRGTFLEGSVRLRWCCPWRQRSCATTATRQRPLTSKHSMGITCGQNWQSSSNRHVAEL